MRYASIVWLLSACGGGASEPTVAADLPTTAVEVRRAAGTLPIAGELRPWQQVELRARLPAYVSERRVDVGDRVALGELLVALSAPDRVAERAEAEASQATAQARVRRLQAAAGRDGVVAALELEEAQGAAGALEARVRALRALERELAVRAPFPGVVTQRGADAGALVGPGSAEALVTVAETERLRLVVSVPEAYVGGAVVGSTVQFRVASGEPRPAVVSRTSGVLDSGTRTLRVELDVDNAAGALLAGSYVDVLWPLDTGVDRVWVPATSVVRTTEGTWVWVRRQDQLARVDVDELQREKGLVAVLADLHAGDVVVTRGSEDLVAGPWPPTGTPAR